MSEQATIFISVFAFLCGYGVCRFLTERKISQAYEDGLMDGSGQAYLKENKRWEKSNTSST